MDDQSLYIQLGRLAESIPNFRGRRPFSTDTHKWLARLYAVLNASDQSSDAHRIKQLTSSMASSASESEINEVHGILFRLLAVAELKAPAPVQGSFIPVGNAFDALSAIGAVLKEESRNLLIVDPYLDERVLTDFAPQIAEGVSIRLLSDRAGYRPTLPPAVSNTRLLAPFRFDLLQNRCTID